MTDRQVQFIKEHFEKVTENKLLSEVTYIKLGGPARIYIELQKKEKVKELIAYALQEEIPFFILGKGCNIVFTDEGYDGIIVRIELGGISCLEEAKIYAEAGATLLDIIFVGHRCGLIGMEGLSGVPSSLGGALFGNAGAGGSEIGEFVEKVEALVFNEKLKTVENVSYSKEEMGFGYRESEIKKNKNSIILSAILKLKKGNSVAAKAQIEDNMHSRAKVQPLAYSSAGCVFKNPPGKSAGRLIQQAGLNGERVGGMMVSEQHGNFIINNNNGTFEEYRALVELARKKVKERFGIDLELEHIIVKNPE